MSMKDIPLGVDDFKKIREKDAYYVDKTGLITDIVSRPATEVFLFTRPRRFGKSMNMSMLDAFFAMDIDGRGLFEGLKVASDERCMKLMNSYPVISISLTGLDSRDYDSFISDLREIVSEACDRHSYLRGWETDSIYRQKFIGLQAGDVTEAELKRSLLTLSAALFKYHGRKAIILIDEYDGVINGSFGTEAHDRILSFMRDFLANAMKGNDNLEFGVMTGVMQIAKESLFSGLNNLFANNIFSTDSDEEFGFTEGDVAGLLGYYGHPEKLDEVRDWYDGYRFGDAEIYNPWSILNYIRRGYIAGPYWLNEGNPGLILESLSLNGQEAMEVVADLYNDGTTTADLNGDLVLSDLGCMDGLLSLMTGSGYLKAVPSKDGTYTLSLVNREVRSGLLKQLTEGRRRSTYVNSISRALLEGHPDIVQKEFGRFLDTQIDSKLTRDERYHQAFMLGLLNCLTTEYYIRSEYRGGKGYADIAIIPRNGKGPSAIIELKDDDPKVGDDAMQNEADRALNQIKELRYFSDLRGLVRMYGIATRQTDVFVSYDELTRDRGYNRWISDKERFIVPES